MSIKVERDGPVTTVTIDRPEVRNAIDQATADALSVTLREFDSDPSSRVAVMAGAGGNFSAGADLKAIAAGETPRLEETGDGPLGVTRLKLGKPVIAAVEGYAVAGGMAIALWCDLRVAGETAVFGMFDRRYGVPMVGAVTVNLPRLIGLSHAMDLILTGRAVDAEEALRMGLANRLVPAGEAVSAAQRLAHELASYPWDCLRGDRKATLEGMDLPSAQGHLNELRIGRETFRGGESQSGASRFVAGQGRHGRFDDRPREDKRREPHD
ncbi:MAG: crotonase/enoyl-CoA hydratase family protein [Myxococcota bacterium]